uniref:RNA-dependent RNA polymerase n=1 Tax=Psoroptes ovis TaxID=83912 RepID=A0A3B0QY96_PSOOV|nr:RNA-dependent RNA polymerase 1-like [Psoroptes ovis]
MTLYKFFFQNASRFDIDFYFENQLNFQRILIDLNGFKNLNDENKIYMELSFNSLDRLNKLSNNTNKRMVEYRLKSLSIGSLINLSDFLNRLRVFDAADCLKFEMDFYKKNLTIYFKLDENFFRLEINFSSIKLLLIEMKANCFYLELNAAPFIFKSNQSSAKEWTRIANLNDYYDNDLIAYSLSYRLQLIKNNLSTSNFFNDLIRLSYVCKELNHSFITLIMISDRNYQKNKLKSKSKVINTKMLNKKYSMKNIFAMIDEHFKSDEKLFPLLYACRVLYSKSYKIIDSLILKQQTMIIFNMIDQLYSKENFDISLIEKLIYILDSHSKSLLIIDLKDEFEKIIETYRQRTFCSMTNVNTNDHVMMKSAVMTPTRIEFYRPMPFLRSRFSNMANLDFSLRLTICEDNNRKLNCTFNHCNNENDMNFIKSTMKTKLSSGIRIGDRLFEFLGSSSSQMRENGIIFYACDNEKRTAKSIRMLVGNLANFKRKVAKYIARFGLVFSQAIAYYHYDSQSVKVYKMDDIKTMNDEYCFTDGIGIISNEISSKINQLLRLPNGYQPSAYQIRNGGCKGMLVCYPIAKNSDNSTNKNMIIFRDSMIKYESNDECLGILKFSAPRLVWLNRPLINILDQQNVPAEVFYKIFMKNTKLIMNALLFEQDAYKLVNIYRNSNLPYQRFFMVGLSFLREPFLNRILKYLLYYRLNELKYRARIAIPDQNGRMAFGVIDETKQLNSGEIFFQYSLLDSNTGMPLLNQTKILENQQVMVTKFPCLSLGDVRKFRAVNIPELSHIKDCLVFPAKGSRPHTDEMGGSDLDGDEYAIFWQTDLIFPGDNYEPMDFINHQSSELNHDINLNDIIEFYCDYLLENNIGQVANCHLMYSDFHPLGLHSTECNELAQKYSISLDFQKNGINSQLEKKYQPDSKWIRPDFMEKRTQYKCYLSENVLGQFHRQCSLIETIIRNWDNDLKNNPQSILNELPDERLILPDWHKYQKEAQTAFDEYNYKLIELMESLLIYSEIELITNVYDTNTSNYLSNTNNNSNKYDISSSIIYEQLFQYFQQKFESQFQTILKRENIQLNNDEQDEAERVRLTLISSWYIICYLNKNKIQYQYRGRSLLGMPFLLPNEMIRLANYCIINQPNDQQQHIQKCKTIVKMSNNLQLATQLKSLTSKWIDQVNVKIFNCKINQKLKIYNNENNSFDIVDESTLISDLIDRKIESIIKNDEYSECFTNYNNSQQIIFELFQKFLLNLYEQCNQIDSIIHNGQLPELLLLRYGMFALNFIQSNQIPLNEEFGDEQIFDSYLDKMFEKFNNQIDFSIDDPSQQQKNYHQFCLLNRKKHHNDNGDRTKFDRIDENFFKKLQFLTKSECFLQNLKIYNENDYCIYALDSKLNEEPY